ncbi:MAG: hypothetical protein IPP13_24180 [Kouleothrix sp.]|jgi:hypothetical protein|nr:hypothetical protein [Kouleothrix sp.]
MEPVETSQYAHVLQTVRSWSAAERLTLIQDVLRTLTLVDRPQRPHPTLDQARGLLRTDRPTPTDAEVAQWLDERRQERFGQ